jgi:hypothetical protein
MGEECSAYGVEDKCVQVIGGGGTRGKGLLRRTIYR